MVKRPFTLDSVFYQITKQMKDAEVRLENLETWEPFQVGAMVYMASNTNVGAGAGYTTIPFDTTFYDTRSIWDATNYQFVAPFAGRYLISVTLWQSATVAAAIHLRVQPGTAAYYATRSFNGNYDGLGLTLPIELEEDETVEVQLDEVGAGTGVNIGGSATNPYLSYMAIELLTKT